MSEELKLAPRWKGAPMTDSWSNEDRIRDRMDCHLLEDEASESDRLWIQDVENINRRREREEQEKTDALMWELFGFE